MFIHVLNVMQVSVTNIFALSAGSHEGYGIQMTACVVYSPLVAELIKN